MFVKANKKQQVILNGSMHHKEGHIQEEIQDLKCSKFK